MSFSKIPFASILLSFPYGHAVPFQASFAFLAVFKMVCFSKSKFGAYLDKHGFWCHADNNSHFYRCENVKSNMFYVPNTELIICGAVMVVNIFGCFRCFFKCNFPYFMYSFKWTLGLLSFLVRNELLMWTPQWICLLKCM